MTFKKVIARDRFGSDVPANHRVQRDANVGISNSIRVCLFCIGNQRLKFVLGRVPAESILRISPIQTCRIG